MKVFYSFTTIYDTSVHEALSEVLGRIIIEQGPIASMLDGLVEVSAFFSPRPEPCPRQLTPSATEVLDEQGVSVRDVVETLHRHRCTVARQAGLRRMLHLS